MRTWETGAERQTKGLFSREAQLVTGIIPDLSFAYLFRDGVLTEEKM